MSWYPHRMPAVMDWLLPTMVYRLSPGRSTLYLTFDDGPDPEATPFVLEALNEIGAKATFFMVGERVEKHPEVVDAVLSQGHRIGNHTYQHLSGWGTAREEYFASINHCQVVLDRHTPAPHKPLFRPPYGRITPRQAKLLSKDYRVVMWSLLSADFDPSVTTRMSLTKLDSSRDGDIIVFHDSHKFLPRVQEVLPEFLKRFHDKGLKFAAIPEPND